jgi:hypothetical protein
MMCEYFVDKLPARGVEGASVVEPDEPEADEPGETVRDGGL